MRTIVIIFVFLFLIRTASASNTTVHPHEGSTWWVGADGQKISLVNNDHAKNPTYAQLITFLKADTTDKRKYASKYKCGDFAETLHNNAEKAGYKAGWVTLTGINHCCNVFKTSDKGLIYIDCTGVSSGSNSCYDTKVSLSKGKAYKRIPLFCKNTYFDSMGTVKSYKIYW
jgi:hypothetical protein